MNRKEKYTASSLDELMGDPIEVEAPKSKVAGTAKYFFGTVITALAVSTLLLPGAVMASSTADAGMDYYYSLSDDVSFVEQALPQHTVLLDSNGKEFARISSTNRQEVSLDEVSDHLVDALISNEDSRFYQHNGIDVVGTGRALLSNLEGNSTQGASTLTQQLVENMLTINATLKGGEEAAAKVREKSATYKGKLQETRLAIAVEEKYSKKEILNLYLNAVYFGNGAYGVHEASHQYFGIDPSKLSIAQSATIAAIVQSPNVFNPIDNLELSDQRRNLVLGRMLAEGTITQQEYDKAVEAKTVVKTTPSRTGCAASEYAHYCSYVVAELRHNPVFGDTAEEREKRFDLGGLTIKTALNPKATDKAEEEIMQAMGPKNRVAVASATVEPGTGHITVMAQSRPWGTGPYETQMNYAASQFSPGSSFKPFTIATALEQGMEPESTIYSSPSHYMSPILDEPPNGYSNYGFYDYGPTNMYKATQISMNVYFIKLLEDVGVRNTAEMARKLGIESLPEHFNGTEGSLTLGAYEMTPIEMANAFATFSSGGMHCNAVAIISAKKTESGKEISVPDPDCRQVVTPSVAHGVTDILKRNFDAPGTARKADLANNRPGAGKTGTSENYAETWFVGYTRQLSTAVWIGDPRGGQQYPLDVVNIFGRTVSSATGEDIAAPMWRNIMDRMHEGMPKLKFPKPGNSPVDSIPSLTVPNVQGMEVNQAITLLEESGFNAAISSKTEKSGDYPPGIVVSQNPAGGKTINGKEVVTVTLSKGSDTGMIIPERGAEQ